MVPCFTYSRWICMTWYLSLMSADTFYNLFLFLLITVHSLCIPPVAPSLILSQSHPPSLISSHARPQVHIRLYVNPYISEITKNIMKFKSPQQCGSDVSQLVKPQNFKGLGRCMSWVPLRTTRLLSCFWLSNQEVTWPSWSGSSSCLNTMAISQAEAGHKDRVNKRMWERGEVGPSLWDLVCISL